MELLILPLAECFGIKHKISVTTTTKISRLNLLETSLISRAHGCGI